MRKRVIFLVGIMVLWMLSMMAMQNVHAQKDSRFRAGSEVRVVKENGKSVLYKKKNVVDFDDALIEGEVKNPNEFYFVHRPEEKFGSLVGKRKNFHKEMLRDAVMIR